MRGGSTASGRRPADLGDDHGLAGQGRFCRDLAKAVGVADALEIEEEDVNAAFIEPPIDVIVRLQHSLIAGAHLVRKTQLFGPAATEKREGQSAALAADRD